MSFTDPYRIKPGKRVKLSHFDPDDMADYENGGKEKGKKDTEKLLGRLNDLQERLYAGGRQSLLIVLQGIDTAGKDGSIKHVMSGVNPQGCRVSSFKAPSAEERSHDFLWRIHKEVPAAGMIGIFNRSHYEDVMVTRVHGLVDEELAEKRFKLINDFERLLTKNGTTILKFFLHISKDEQKERLQARLDDPTKHWKFNMQDLAERKLWPRYEKAFEEAISATSTQQAPWYVVPANRNWYRNLVLATVIVAALEKMNPQFPPPPKGIHFAKVRIP